MASSISSRTGKETASWTSSSRLSRSGSKPLSRPRSLSRPPAPRWPSTRSRSRRAICRRIWDSSCRSTSMPFPRIRSTASRSGTRARRGSCTRSAGTSSIEAAKRMPAAPTSSRRSVSTADRSNARTPERGSLLDPVTLLEVRGPEPLQLSRLSRDPVEERGAQAGVHVDEERAIDDLVLEALPLPPEVDDDLALLGLEGLDDRDLGAGGIFGARRRRGRWGFLLLLGRRALRIRNLLAGDLFPRALLRGSGFLLDPVRRQGRLVPPERERIESNPHRLVPGMLDEQYLDRLAAEEVREARILVPVLVARLHLEPKRQAPGLPGRRRHPELLLRLRDIHDTRGMDHPLSDDAGIAPLREGPVSRRDRTLARRAGCPYGFEELEPHVGFVLSDLLRAGQLQQAVGNRLERCLLRGVELVELELG